MFIITAPVSVLERTNLKLTLAKSFIISNRSAAHPKLSYFKQTSLKKGHELTLPYFMYSCIADRLYIPKSTAIGLGALVTRSEANS